MQKIYISFLVALCFCAFTNKVAGQTRQNSNSIKKDEWKILWAVFTNTQFMGASTSISDAEYNKIVNQANKFETFVENAVPSLDVKITVVKDSDLIVKNTADNTYGPFLERNDVLQQLNNYSYNNYDGIIAVADLTALRSQMGYAGLTWGWDFYSFIPFWRDLPLQDDGYPWYEPHTEHVFVHEWLHQIEWWFDHLGYTVPELHDSASYGFPNENDNGWGDWYNAYLKNELQGGVSSGINPGWWKFSPTGTTGIPAPDREINVFSAKGILTVNSPSAERIDIYSFNGMRLYSSVKQEGTVTYLIGGFHEKTLIVKGSSGWVRKIVNVSF